MPDAGTALLKDIIGKELSSVKFVQNYVQLRFGGSTLTAYTHPAVTTHALMYVWGDPAYRNELCELIGVQVVAATAGPHAAISITFANGAALQISLKREDFEGPEAAMFTNPVTKQWFVWRDDEP